MSQGIFAKVRVLSLASIHSILDAGIDVMSVSALKVHIRDLEDARANMRGTLAEANFDLEKQQTDVTKLETEDAALVKSIKNLTSGANGIVTVNQKAAEELAGKLVRVRDQLPKERNEVVTAQKTVDGYRKVVTALVAKEGSMKASLANLETQEASAKAQDKAAAAIEAAAGALSGPSVDNLADKIGKKHARATARLDAAMGQVESPAETTESDARARALLAELTGNAS